MIETKMTQSRTLTVEIETDGSKCSKDCQWVNNDNSKSVYYCELEKGAERCLQPALRDALEKIHEPRGPSTPKKWAHYHEKIRMAREVLFPPIRTESCRKESK